MKIDLLGYRFGRLLVIDCAIPKIEKNGIRAQWLCLCDCGKEVVVIGKQLRQGKTKSCGCLRDDVCGNKNPFYGKKHSQDTLFELSVLNSGVNNPNYGKHHSEETKEKISQAQIGEKNHMYGIRGEKHPRWSGGSPLRMIDMGRSEYRQWRLSVFKRDNFTCQICGKHGGDINAHHINPWKTHLELRYSLENGVTYCRRCHIDKHRSIKNELYI